MLTNISVELAGFIATLVVYVVGIHVYYARKIKAIEEKMNASVDTKISSHKESSQEELTIRFDMMNKEIEQVKKEQEKANEKYERINEALSEIKISVAEIRTLLKGSLNGNK